MIKAYGLLLALIGGLCPATPSGSATNVRPKSADASRNPAPILTLAHDNARREKPPRVKMMTGTTRLALPSVFPTVQSVLDHGFDPSSRESEVTNGAEKTR